MQDFNTEFTGWLDSDEGKHIIREFKKLYEGLPKEHWVAFRDQLLLPALLATYEAGVDTDLLTSAYQSGYMDGSTLLDNPLKVH